MNLRLLYLYLFSFIGLLITIIGCIRIVDLGLKTYVFTAANQVNVYPRTIVETDKGMPTPEQEAEFQIKNQRQMQANTVAESLAMIVVGAPIYLYHWSTIKKENKSS